MGKLHDIAIKSTIIAKSVPIFVVYFCHPLTYFALVDTGVDGTACIRSSDFISIIFDYNIKPESTGREHTLMPGQHNSLNVLFWMCFCFGSALKK